MARGKRDDVDMGELNLVPIMALLVVLIPVLLFAFTFVDIKIQAVQAPKMGTGSAKKKDDAKKPLMLTVAVKKDGFIITMQSEQAGEPEPPIPMRSIDGVDVHDYATLYSRIVVIKGQYKDEKTVTISAEMDIPWHILAKTIDCVRVELEKPSYTDLKEYADAKPKEGLKVAGEEPKNVPLFPAVVFGILGK